MGPCRMLRYLVNDHASQRGPKFAYWLASMLPSRIVQADSLLGRDERRCQIPSENLFL